MTTSPGFQVDPGQIRAHAGTVGGIAGQLSSVGGGLPGGLGDHALGTFVQFLTAGLQTAMAKSADAVTHGSRAVDNMSSALTRAADSYQHIDGDHAARLHEEDTL